MRVRGAFSEGKGCLFGRSLTRGKGDEIVDVDLQALFSKRVLSLLSLRKEAHRRLT